jgi:hypothetical protein
MMYFFLLKKLVLQNLFGNNKLVDFSKNKSKKIQKQTSLTLLKITPMPTRMKKTEVETKQQVKK